MTPMLRGFCACVLSLILAACAGEEPARTTQFHDEGYPALLSDWGAVVQEDGLLRLADDALPYDLATPLFSDYALKLRTVSLPDGASAAYVADDVFDFPVGTVITKTFYYAADGDGGVRYHGAPSLTDKTLPMNAVRLIETRILAHRADGWVAIPYVWNEAQTDAELKRIGAIKRLDLTHPDGRQETFDYVAPTQNQCAGCHAPNNTTRDLSPIGPKARHLNKPSSFQAGMNQLDHWRLVGVLAADEAAGEDAPQNAVWDSAAFTLDQRARAYLDANCSHCHNPKGPADTSGLNLEPNADGPALGRCKSPIAAGDGAGGRLFDIVPGHPDDSIVVFRMETTNPGAMMPELGRSLAHKEGVQLIRAWIEAMDGDCA